MLIMAPQSGAIYPISTVSDPVFAGELVGAGVAIHPLSDTGPSRALAPLAGRLAKVLPHAFIVRGAVDVLVHLGIDTVRLKGEGFTVLACEGAEVLAGDPVIEWDPLVVSRAGLSPMVMMCVLDSAPGSVDPGQAGRHVEAGAEAFSFPDGTDASGGAPIR